ncbi:small conductance mechanosensitive channel [Kaistia soli DSM 19436]|uniref:Small-conductance mechanosensitive channel n=1 Tax=Kaistia soli DSM 19436 TaxID=1122133 RepID=A0A1M4YVU9_9HYPH|nr:mechanosensitive ion channel domain-containing protein [Kaistia soli]SHF09954.1 small conductance mechanosensitive channel [Kaistia soli DSM 19436]
MDSIAPNDLGALPAMAWTWSVAFLPRILTAALIVVAGIFIARAAGRFVAGMGASVAHIDRTVRPVLGAVVRYGILVLTFIAALGQLGVQTASLLAVLGAAGLAIGLALQGTLTNIAAGIMLLWLRPFRAGDYIELVSGSIAGTIEEMGLFACRLVSYDGVVIFAPNSTIWNVALRNHSQSRSRLIAYQINLPSGTDVDAARAVLGEVTRSTADVKEHPAPDITVEKTTQSGLVLLCRFWAERGKAGAVQRFWPDAARQRLEDGLNPQKPVEIVRLLPTDADPSRLLGTI